MKRHSATAVCGKWHASGVVGVVDLVGVVRHGECGMDMVGYGPATPRARARARAQPSGTTPRPLSGTGMPRLLFSSLEPSQSPGT